MTDTPTTTLEQLKPSQIKPHKLNPRREVGDVAELAASIAEQGIVEPLIVASNGTGESYTLLAGHRRLAAARIARLKTVPCLVRSDLTDPKRQIELMLVENLQRSDLSPVEESEAYQQLLTFPGYTQKRIAETTGRAIATVRNRLKLAKLPKAAITSVHEGQMSLGEAEALTTFADDEPRFKQLVAAVGTQQFPYLLKRLTADRAEEKKNTKVLAELKAAGVRIKKSAGYDPNCLYLHGDDIETHRDCPGFCATVGWNGSTNYYCDQANLHKPADEAAAQRAKEEAAAAEKAVYEDSAHGRREHFALVIQEDADEDLALRILRDHVISAAVKVPWMAKALGIDTLMHTIDNGPPKPADVRAKLETLDVYQLTVVLDLVKHFEYENKLASAWGWCLDGGPWDPAAGWRDRLVEVYGYEWSEFELELLARADKARADLAAPKHEPTDDDDEDVDDDGDHS